MVKKLLSPQISVVIVTKNRSRDLIACIGSLLVQSEEIDELIIVDNDSSDETASLILNLKKNCVMNIKYIQERRVGYPIIYNRGLKETRFPWVAFIDDDCVAHPDWFSSIKKSIKKHRNAAVIVGKSNTYFNKNMFSLATLFFNQMWKENGKIEEKITYFETLDNKNITYNKDFLVKNNLEFNEKRFKENNGAGEDVDLGLQISKKKGKAFFVSNMLIQHKDPITFSSYFMKLKFAQNAAKTVENYSEPIAKDRKYRIRNWFHVFSDQQSLNTFLKIKVFSLIVTTVFWQRLWLRH